MTSLKTLILGTVMAGALFAPALARAEDSAPADKGPGMHEKFDPRKAFEEADADKNGTLNMDEFLSRHREKFAEIDADKSGSLTPDEMKAYGEKMHGIRKERREDRREQRKENREQAPAAGASNPTP